MFIFIPKYLISPFQLGSFTLGGVHQIIEAMKSGDYQSALQIHGQTVAKGNFSEMSQFMPAIKMLLQTCMQLQVFLQKGFSEGRL